MTLSSITSWNNTVICVDDEDGILDFYRQVLTPQVSSSVDSLRELRSRRRSWRVDEEAPAPSPKDSFRLLTARSGEEAIELVRAEVAAGRSVAAGFFDMKMPGGIDGLETIRAIREIDPQIMCAVVTAYTDRAISQIGSIFRHQDEWIYFNKPFTEWELTQAVRNLVAGWNIRRDRERTLGQLQDSNVQLLQANEKLLHSYLATVKAVVMSLEAKDPYTAGHSQRVAHFSRMLARKLRLAESEAQAIYEGALLHDVGKIGIDDCILKKAGKLTREEFEIMKSHPVVGARILEPVSHLAHVTHLVRHHHEWYDGRGYPDGLVGQSIPIGARIVAVADTFDALTSTRSYRRACSISQATEVLVGCQHTQHDPEVTQAFMALMRENLEEMAAWIAPEAYVIDPAA